MTAEEARLELAARVAADLYPELSDAELDAILNTVKIQDPSGYRPSDAAYTGAWDLDRAEITAWRRKAAKVVSDTDFNNPAGSVSQDQLHRHCLAMANEVKQRLIGAVGTVAPVTIDGVTI